MEEATGGQAGLSSGERQGKKGDRRGGIRPSLIQPMVTERSAEWVLVARPPSLPDWELALGFPRQRWLWSPHKHSDCHTPAGARGKGLGLPPRNHQDSAQSSPEETHLLKWASCPGRQHSHNHPRELPKGTINLLEASACGQRLESWRD